MGKGVGCSTVGAQRTPELGLKLFMQALVFIVHRVDPEGGGEVVRW